MPLTAAQLQTLKTALTTSTAVIATGPFAGVQVKDVPNSSDGNVAVSDWLNTPTSPAFVVWRDLDIAAMLSFITFANMTPTDAVPTDTALSVAIWEARSLACQGKQLNLQNLIISRTTAPMKQANYRAAIQDALTGLPAGAGGAAIAANWVGVRDAAKGTATNGEKLYATGTGSTAAPADLVVEGRITPGDVNTALNLP